MTRCDLEEVITNLEYLMRRSDPAEAESYYQQLQAFRQELRDLDERKGSLTFPVPSRFLFRQH
jgi:ABC-type Zn uptake system ZnuABC Zn-binding protein ZnuA